MTWHKEAQISMRILLADDHEVLRQGLRVLLDAVPDIAVVGEAANGRDAVRMANELRPTVVVMDIAMPDLNGIEATQQIREALPETQVVILSMHSAREYVHRALKAGALGYLLKENAGGEVVIAVHAVSHGRRYLCERISDTLVEDYLSDGDAPRPRSPLELLSHREREVLQLVAEGQSSAAIANTLFLAASTVETYRKRIMQKLNLHDLTALVRFAIQQGLTSLDG